MESLFYNVIIPRVVYTVYVQYSVCGRYIYMSFEAKNKSIHHYQCGMLKAIET